MRRKLAYILLGATIVLSAAVTIGPTLVQMDTDVSYGAGKDLYFKLSTAGSTYQGVFPSDYLTENNGGEACVDAVAKEMENRLKTWDINGTVSKEGYDTVKVSLRAQKADETEYSYLQQYLAFSGGHLTVTFGCSTTSVATEENINTYLGASYYDNAMFAGQTAAITYISQGTTTVPVVTIPVNSTGEEGDLNKLIKFCTSNTHSANSSEGTSAQNCYIVIWDHFQGIDNAQERDNFASASDTSATSYDANMAKRLIFGESASNAWYEPSDTDDKYKKMQLLPSSEAITESGYDSSKEDAAVKAAKKYVCLLNASDYATILGENSGCDVSFAYSTDIAASVENLISLGDWHLSPAFGATMIAFLASLAVGLLILAFYYHWGALAIASNVAVATLGSLLLFAYFSAQFGVGALVGIFLSALATAFGGIYYFAKVKEELYQGRSPKKAHQEAIKKALWPTLDASIIQIVLGLCVYGLVPSVIGKCGLVLVLGGFFGGISNVVLLRLEGWLLANDNDVEKSLGKTYGVDESKLVDPLKEEKQNYFGVFADTDFQKPQKGILIAAGALLAASIVGVSVFSALNGDAYNFAGAYDETTTVSVEYRVVKGSSLTKILGTAAQVKEKFLAAYSVNGTSLDKYISGDIVSETSESTDSSDSANIVVYTVYYYEITLSHHFDLSTTYDNNELVVSFDSTKYTDLPTAISEGVATLASSGLENKAGAVASIQNSIPQAGTPSFGNVFLACGIAMIALMIYDILRYKASRGVAVSLIAATATLAVAGFFSLSRLAVTPMVNLGMVAAVLLAYILPLFILNKAKEIEKDSRERDKSTPAFLNDCLKKANSQAAGDLILFGFVAAASFILFYGLGPASWRMAYLGSFLGFLLALGMSLTILYALSVDLAKLFKQIHLSFHPLKKETPNSPTGGVTKKKGAEPEEAVFIGIND